MPDASFVIPDGSHETAWLELKAADFGIIAPCDQPMKFDVRQSQHQWIEIHYRYAPVWFMIGYHNLIYFISGEHHSKFDNRLSPSDLRKIATGTYTLDNLLESRLLLSEVSQRK